MTVLPTLVVAVVSAGSVLGGVFLTNRHQGQLDRDRAVREDTREIARQARALRLAVRLVAEELADSYRVLCAAVDQRRYWPASQLLSSSVWTEYRASIATIVEDPGDWRQITAAFDAANRLNRIVQYRQRTSQVAGEHLAGYWVDPADETRAAWRAFRDGLDTLDRVLGLSETATRQLSDREATERKFWPLGDGAEFSTRFTNAEEALPVWRNEF